MLLKPLPNLPAEWGNEAIMKKFEIVHQVLDEFNRKLSSKALNSSTTVPYAKKLIICINENNFTFLKEIENELSVIFQAPVVEIHHSDKFNLEIQESPFEKCPRCWIYSAESDSLCERCKVQEVRTVSE